MEFISKSFGRLGVFLCLIWGSLLETASPEGSYGNIAVARDQNFFEVGSFMRQSILETQVSDASEDRRIFKPFFPRATYSRPDIRNSGVIFDKMDCRGISRSSIKSHSFLDSFNLASEYVSEGTYARRTARKLYEPLSVKEIVLSSGYNGYLGDIINLSNNMFVVTWTDANPTIKVLAQLFDKHGNSVTDAFQISETSNIVYHNSICGTMLESGSYVIVWENIMDIYGRIYDNTISRTSEFKVNTKELYNNGQRHQMVSLKGGGFVVSYKVKNSDIFAQIFDSEGQKLGSEFVISNDCNRLYDIGLAASNEGGFLAVCIHNIYSDYVIIAKLYDNSGNQLGDEFMPFSLQISRPSYYTTSLKNGNYLIAAKYDDLGHGIYGQLFQSDGTKIGNKFTIKSNSDPAVYPHDIDWLYNGGFVLMYHTDSPSIITIERFDSSGSPTEDPFQVGSEDDLLSDYAGKVESLMCGIGVSWASYRTDLLDYLYTAKVITDSATSFSVDQLIEDSVAIMVKNSDSLFL